MKLLTLFAFLAASSAQASNYLETSAARALAQYARQHYPQETADTFASTRIELIKIIGILENTDLSVQDRSRLSLERLPKWELQLRRLKPADSTKSWFVKGLTRLTGMGISQLRSQIQSGDLTGALDQARSILRSLSDV